MYTKKTGRMTYKSNRRPNFKRNNNFVSKVRNKGNVLIDQIEPVGNYAIRIIFSDNHSSGIYSWGLLHDFGKNHDKYLQEYYNSL